MAWVSNAGSSFERLRQQENIEQEVQESVLAN
jgi:hypothetical protein